MKYYKVKNDMSKLFTYNYLFYVIITIHALFMVAISIFLTRMLTILLNYIKANAMFAGTLNELRY